MIINHLSAEHVLKYRRLKLLGLPNSGLITISGQNESGKSTIGETVCFALFGRTFSVGDGDLARVIHWAEPRCKVTLGFSKGDEDFEITRFLDRDGNHGARFYKPGKEDRPIAKGVAAVAEALEELLGYSFDEFIESFYLAQREITTPQPHSHTIKTMAGISALERVARRLTEERDEAEDEIPEIKTRAQEARDDLKSLSIVPGHLESLQAEATEMTKAGEVLTGQKTDLASAAESYRESIADLRAARVASRRAYIIAFPLLLIAVVAACLCVALNALDYSHGFLTSLRSMGAGFWDGSKTLPLWISIGTGVVGLIAGIFGLSRDRRAKTLSHGGSALSGVLEAIAKPIAGLDGAAEVNAAETIEPPLPRLQDDIRKAELDQPSLAALVADSTAALDQRCDAQQRAEKRTFGAVKEESHRRSRGESLEKLATELDAKLVSMHRGISVREAANDLVKSSAHHISRRFNRDLRDLASRSLPLFTEGRYEHLQIDDDLEVRAFSSEKRDFVDLDEVSSGTQRQIMLAVRLALSQELVMTTRAAPQFLFLDEPFAFFDACRTKKAMEALPAVSDAITQIWVIAQEFPEASGSALDIRCTRDTEELVIG